MSYFLFDGIIALDEIFFITGKEAQHIIYSRRIQSGEFITIQDRLNNRYQAKVLQIKKNEIELIPQKRQLITQQPSLDIHLYQALVKEKSLDFIIQKTTELGAASIIFFHSRYSQRLKSPDAINRKLNRWKRIAIEACKQSGRLKPPAVGFVGNLQKSHQFLSDSSTESFSTICLTSVGQTVPLSHLAIKNNTVNLLVGPEGGWEASELELIDCHDVHLGPRTLRSETAAVTAVGILQYLFGDLQEKLIP